MYKNFRFLIVVFIFTFCIFNLMGCASFGRQKDLQIQGLRNQISVLEAQIQGKDQEIIGLREALIQTTEAKGSKAGGKKKVVAEVKSRPNVRQIQVALQNAGYHPGIIDGRMGRQTKEAIRAFQRANNLSVDGKAGKQTWALLKEYLYKKIK